METVRPAPPPSAGDTGPDLLPQAPAPRHPGPSAAEVEDLLARLTGADDVPPPPDRTDRTDPAGER
ncbi:hypothetical protein [Kocuria sp. SM24M-10]|uniref:hypothetical protein n=1 Tax=Kocuria sp. SM24M-10 TaxID=1660349 RepID=UPI0006493406|nr:hypothetical protein [Kocuria sp. SM24M-10]KLU11034.1 hypothetical protein ABL57_03450 [Kocuria sp. SM24M-10]